MLKKIVLMALCVLFISRLASAQSHFMYIQSEKGTPFYIKMNDSLLSSTHSGYLVLHKLAKGTYPIIVGFAKKKIPEAAFSIVIDDSGDKGYTLRSVGNKLQLENIQNGAIMQPVEVATSAGNRILPSTIADIQAEQQNESPSITAHTETPSPADTKEDANTTAPQDDPFEKMLNAVTGSKTPTAPVAQNQEKQHVKDTVPETVQTVAANLPDNEDTPPPAENQNKKPSFFDLINPDKNKKTVKTPASPEPVTAESSTPVSTPSQTANPDLTFIDFSDTEKQPVAQRQDSDVNNDSLITSGKELREWKRRQRQLEKQKEKKESGSFFDNLLEKVDTVSAENSTSPSVAAPLFGDEQQQNNAEEAGIASTQACTEIADESYFNKVRRKIASKKSQEAMLRTANHYLSGDKCFAVSQIRQLAYSFATDDYRLQFLKAAYAHCSEKDNFKTLTNTLSNKSYQNQLKAYLR